MYLAWFDADKKKPVVQKMKDGIVRYREKFGKEPVEILISPKDYIKATIGNVPINLDTVKLREVGTIGENCFWIGRDDEE